jgi:L-alanine-DL-glutamate epimerase-like enolase superfamily enzyme
MIERTRLQIGSNLIVRRVRCATVRHELEIPLQFNRWRITHREFAIVRVDTEEGASGFSYGLTRDGPVASIVKRNVAPVYEGRNVNDPLQAFLECRLANHATLSAGVGMRALSLVDIAVWDALARTRELGIARLLGGSPKPHFATSIIGYPPTMSPAAVRDEVSDLVAQGWTRFKAPVAGTPQLTEGRLTAARTAAGNGWVGLDANYSLGTVDVAVDLEQKLRHLGLGWIEDPLPQGDAAALAEMRHRILTPIAVGDDQGGSYHPEALLAASAVDVLRVDATSGGGVSGMIRIVDDAKAAGVPISPHMFPHFHTRILDGLNVEEYPAEWGIPGAGVHPMDDSLEQPQMSGGVMAPLPEDPGFGRIVDPVWLSKQDIIDDDEMLNNLPDDACM